MYIAVCDDQIEELEKLTALLQAWQSDRRSDVRFQTFRSGGQLLDAARAERFTLYLLDVLMPGMTGMDAAREIRSFDAAADIIFLTTSPGFAYESYGVRAAEYLLKPINAKLLYPVLDKLYLRDQKPQDGLTVKSNGMLVRLPFSHLSYVEVNGDDSFKILLYGLLTILFIIAFVYTWRLNVKQNRISEEILATGKKLKSGKDDLRSVLDDQFHKTLLALPITGILVFTIIPILFMILVAFTNYDGAHDGYSNLFTWVGLSNFNELISSSSADANLSYTFGEILSWTLMWAFFATFTNYFLGMLVAILINKKGIHFKKLWRGILVLTIAVPQFISLLYVSKLFDTNGVVNAMLLKLGFIDQAIRFWENTTSARILVIVINIWVGIPYLMLVSTGILMNIPQDLYESSKIDGASVWQQYMKITLPYMLFVTGPYLLTQFIGNINNFNVIYLLTSGRPASPDLVTSGGSATTTDLLITWLFNITTGATSNYKLAAVIAIMIFVVVAVLSLIVYNVIPSTRNEEDYS